MQGWLYPADDDREAKRKQAAVGVDMREEVFRAVAPREPIRYAGGELTVLLVDAGAKDNIVRSLLARGASVIRAPWHARSRRARQPGGRHRDRQRPRRSEGPWRR